MFKRMLTTTKDMNTSCRPIRGEQTLPLMIWKMALAGQDLTFVCRLQATTRYTKNLSQTQQQLVAMLLKLAAPLSPLDQSFALPVIQFYSWPELLHFMKGIFKRTCMTSCHKSCTQNHCAAAMAMSTVHIDRPLFCSLFQQPLDTFFNQMNIRACDSQTFFLHSSQT